jgi:hypothetical protein
MSTRSGGEVAVTERNVAVKRVSAPGARALSARTRELLRRNAELVPADQRLCYAARLAVVRL